MGDLLLLFLVAVVCYLIGSLNGSLLLSKLILKDDIRKHGSGNAGATNVLRTYGKVWTVAVSVWDMGKAALAMLSIWLVQYIFGGFIWGTFGMWVPSHESLNSMLCLLSVFEVWAPVTAGLFVIIGHILPVFFGFKGGKGVITACMVMLLLDWPVACIALAFFFALVFWKRYISLGSMVATAVLPVASLILGRDLPQLVFTTLIAVLAVFLHRENIKRLLNGTENKFGAKKKE